MITFTIGPTITFSKVWYRDERTTVRVHTRLLRIRITTGSWIPQAASIEKEEMHAKIVEGEASVLRAGNAAQRAEQTLAEQQRLLRRTAS